MFTPSIGIGTTMNGFGGNVLPTSIEIVDDLYTGYHDGLHVVVNHKNHGMYHETNYVTISDVEGDVLPTRLSSPYSSDSTAAISVDSSTNFLKFENVGVAVSNPGYVKIGDEILKYTGVSGNTLTGIDRSTENTFRSSHLEGALVTKYELGGVSLRRINKTHYLGDVTDAVMDAEWGAPIGYDHYTIKLDMSSATGVGRSSVDDVKSFPKLYANESKSTGGFNTKATQNMPFEIISPQVHNITVPGTTVTGQIRTLAGTSLDDGSGKGADIPFGDKGWEAITLNKTNYLNNTRCIASRINETSSNLINENSGNRSLNLRLNLESSDSRISPIIDTQRMNVILTSNRCDAPILDYADDPRVADPFADPSGCQYISKENVLQNGATSIKIIFDGHMNQYNDIRAFYAISDTSNFDARFVPFPGFTNLDEKQQVIDESAKDGRPDRFVGYSDPGFVSSDIEFKEFSFSAENLPKFIAYRIKIVLASRNQTYPPRISALRVLTLA